MVALLKVLALVHCMTDRDLVAAAAAVRIHVVAPVEAVVEHKAVGIAVEQQELLEVVGTGLVERAAAEGMPVG